MHHRIVLEQRRTLGMALGEASALHNLGLVAAARGDRAAALQCIVEAATRYEAIGDEAGATVARTNLSLYEAHWARHSGGDDERR